MVSRTGEAVNPFLQEMQRILGLRFRGTSGQNSEDPRVELARILGTEFTGTSGWEPEQGGTPFKQLASDLSLKEGRE
jgi:hypothetical protein